MAYAQETVIGNRRIDLSMKNAQYDSRDIKKTCEKKLKIIFTDAKEYNGWYWLDGVKVLRITVPKGRKFVPPGTYANMARQLKLKTGEFDQLLDCPLKKEPYDKLIRPQIVITNR